MVKLTPQTRETYNDGPSNGRHCYFFQKNGVGYKLYPNKHETLHAVRCQRWCYKMGIAPKPGSFFKLRRPIYSHHHEKWLRYGYTTALAHIHTKNDIDENYETIREILDNKDIKYDDFCWFNIGIYKGKPVIIDFGWDGFKDKRTRRYINFSKSPRYRKEKYKKYC